MLLRLQETGGTELGPRRTWPPPVRVAVTVFIPQRDAGGILGRTAPLGLVHPMYFKMFSAHGSLRPVSR